MIMPMFTDFYSVSSEFWMIYGKHCKHLSQPYVIMYSLYFNVCTMTQAKGNNSGTISTYVSTIMLL